MRAADPSPARSASVIVRVATRGDSLAAWDELVRGHPSGDVAQLSGWARLRGRAGMAAINLVAERRRELVGGAQILVRRVPGVGAVGYLPYGPLVRDETAAPEGAYQALADALEAMTRRRLHALFVQPPAGADQVTQCLLERGFRPSDAGIAPAASVRVDLTVDEAQLRANMSRRLRGWTNQWENKGVRVRTGSRADLALIAELLVETGGHQGFAPFGLDYLTAMYDELVASRNVVAFVGEAAERPVAAALHTACGGSVKSRLVGFDRSSDAAKLNVPAAIDWTAIRWAKARGYRWFDHGGLSEAAMQMLQADEPIDVERLYGPDRHKLRLGGSAFRYPQPVELISSALMRTGYDLVRRLPVGRELVARAKRSARTGPGRLIPASLSTRRTP